MISRDKKSIHWASFWLGRMNFRMLNLVSSFPFLISSFPFLISRFLVPTFSSTLVTQVQILGPTSEFESVQWDRKAAFIRIMRLAKEFMTFYVLPCESSSLTILWLTALFQVLATSGCKSVNRVNQSESRIQILILQFDWMARFSLLQPDVARTWKNAVLKRRSKR